MRILIVGSKGFIGSHCVEYYTKQGNEVWQADVCASDELNYFLLEKGNTNFENIFLKQNFDFCINASGSANVNFSFQNPAVDFELNVINVHKLLVAIRQHNPACRLVNFSSAAVYGNPKSLPISEATPVMPLSPYGFHKLQSDYLLAEYSKFFGLKTCSLRVFSVYGPGLKKQLFWDFYQKTLNERALVLFGTGKETRDFIYIDDLVSALDAVINNFNEEFQIYNVGNGKQVSIESAARIFVNSICYKGNIIFSGQERTGDPLNWEADISKLAALRYEQKISFEEGINRYIQWLRENE
jgi:UDP-glucose 4-epimerase